MIYGSSGLIAYTNNGQIFSYNTIYDRFDLLINLHKTINNDKFDVYNLLIDDSGDFWIALNNGVNKYHSGKLTLIERVTEERYSIVWLDTQHLILAKPTGFWSLNIKSLESKCLFRNDDTHPFLISSLFLDKTHNNSGLELFEWPVLF